MHVRAGIELHLTTDSFRDVANFFELLAEELRKLFVEALKETKVHSLLVNQKRKQTLIFFQLPDWPKRFTLDVT